MVRVLADDEVAASLTIRDLTDPLQGPHAMQLLIDSIEHALAERWHVPVIRERADPIVSIHENYDRLLIPQDAVARDARYTRYVRDDAVLRTHASAIVPQALDRLAVDPPPQVVLSCPGICYRRDSIDRHHVGEPHQLDVWRIDTDSGPLDMPDLEELINVVIQAALGPRRWRTVETGHPYTVGGVQVDVLVGDAWLEVGECGVAHPAVLRGSGLSVPPASGLAMGLGLDRLLMVRKGIDDIRLLRATDARIADQMLDLQRYRPVSSMPAVRRDLSIAVAPDTTPELLGDRVRAVLGDDASSVEQINVVSETSYEELPRAARDRLGIRPGQKNMLVRVVLRDLDRTLTDDDANRLRDRIYASVHEGTVWMWAQRPATPLITNSARGRPDPTRPSSDSRRPRP